MLSIHDQPPREKLDARLAALRVLPADVVADMLRRDRLAGALPLHPVRLEPSPEPAAKALHGLALGAEGSVIASVLIHFAGDASWLVAAGARVHSVVQGVAAVDVPLDALHVIERDPAVSFIELSEPLRPLLDASVPSIGVDPVPRGAETARGAGVIIGVIDFDGIDIHHPDFCVDAGSGAQRTRILSVWDQTRIAAPGDRAPDPWSYGVEHTSVDIDRAVAAGAIDPAPTGGHGTHVTGIAAGNGRASEGRYTGVAPEADIVFVTLLRAPGQSVGSSTSLVDALHYVFARAGDRPCVVNLSAGTQSGPRDGTSLTERAIDALVSTPGRAVVVAAGNEGERRRHAEGVIPGSGDCGLGLVIPQGTHQPDAVEIWYPGSARLDVTIVGPEGDRLGPVSPASAASFVVAALRITVSSTVGDARNGDNCIAILVQPMPPGTATRGVFTIALQSSLGSATPEVEIRYHATLTGTSGIVWNTPATGTMIATPAAAEGAITVANCLHRYASTASSSSSRGPTRDGRRKPDFAAPGSGIWSAAPSVGPAARDARYVQRSGSSMAAPHVAGLVALIYERYGKIDTHHLKSILRESADRTGLTPGWDAACGWGRVHAPGSRLH